MDMTPFYEYLLQKDLKILLYNGDVDMACNFLGSKWFVEGLNQKVRSVHLKHWHGHLWLQVLLRCAVVVLLNLPIHMHLTAGEAIPSLVLQQPDSWLCGPV